MLLVLLVLLLLVERRISRKHRESQLSNSGVRVWNGRARRRRAGKVEGAERKDDRRYGGEGGRSRKVKGLEEQGILQEIQKRYGEGVDDGRSGVQVGPKLGQTGQRRDASCP